MPFLRVPLSRHLLPYIEFHDTNEPVISSDLIPRALPNEDVNLLDLCDEKKGRKRDVSQ